MSRTASIIVLLLLLPSAIHAQHLARMLESGPFATMPGKLLRLIEGPVTGGDLVDVAIADWDGDGRPDLLLGSGYGDLLHYRYLAHGIFAEPEAMISSPTRAYDWPPELRQVSPEVMDWNGDGHPDLVLGWGDQLLWYPHREGHIGAGQPMVLLDGTTVGDAVRQTAPDTSHLAPTAGDLDSDGDADLILGGDDGSIWWLANAGDGAWAAPQRITAGKQPLVVGRRARPCLADWDQDGAADLLIGDAEGRLWLCLQVGGEMSAPTQIPLSDDQRFRCLTPRLAPEGDEFWVGTAGGLIAKAVRTKHGGLVWRGYVQGRHPPLDVGQGAAVCPVDWDSDGDLDLLAGNRAGAVQLFERVDSPGDCLLRAGKTVRAASGVVKASDGCAWPRGADADGDGDMDLFVGTGAGRVELWINSGSFVRAGFLTVAGQPIRTSGPALVAPCDYDGDGDVDLFVGGKASVSSPPGEATIPPGKVAYFENVANSRHSLPVFSKGTLLSICIQPSSALADLDAAALGPQLTEPLDTTADGTTRFLLLADLGVFLFRTQNSRGSYPFLRVRSALRRLPPAVVPPVYSVCSCDLYGTGTPALLCGTDQYGMVLAYTNWLPDTVR